MKLATTPLTLAGLCLAILSSCSPDRNALSWLHQTERNWAKLEQQQPDWPEMLDSAALQSRLVFLSAAIVQAQKWNNQALQAAIKTRLTNLSTDFVTAQQGLETQQNDPRTYNLGLRLQRFFKPDQILGTTDLETLEKYLDQAPAFYQQAKQKLKSPAPALCDSAIAQHIIGITYLKGALGTKIKESNLPEDEQRQLEQKITNTCLYMQDYLAWCRSTAFEARN